MIYVRSIALDLTRAFAATVLGLALFVTLPLVVAAQIKLPGASIGVALRFVPLIALELAPHLIPAAVAFAVVAVLGCVARDGEWTAWQAAGGRPFRVLAPVLVLAAVAGSASWWAEADLVPRACLAEHAFRASALREALVDASADVTELRAGPLELHARARDGADFVDAWIRLRGNETTPSRTATARRARVALVDDALEIDLVDARIEGRSGEASSGTTRWRIDADEWLGAPGARTPTKLRYRTSRELVDLAGDRSRVAERFELQRRRAAALESIAAALAAAWLGLVASTRRPVLAYAAAAVSVLAIDLASTRLLARLAESSALAPELAAWSVPLVATACAALLVRRAWRPRRG